MPARITAILPKKTFSPGTAEQEFRRYLENFVIDFKQEMQEYPPDRPWQSRMPRSGPRAGGARTGRYGEGWANARVTYSFNKVSVSNPVRYAGVVGGRYQTATLAARGWKTTEEVAPEVAARHLPDFATRIWS